MFMSEEKLRTDYTHSYRELQHREQMAAVETKRLRGHTPEKHFANVMAELQSGAAPSVYKPSTVACDGSTFADRLRVM